MAREVKIYLFTLIPILLLMQSTSSYPEEIDLLSEKELTVRLHEHFVKIGYLEVDVANHQGKISRLSKENSDIVKNMQSLETKNDEKDKMLAEIFDRLKVLEELNTKYGTFEEKMALLEEKNRASEANYSKIKKQLDDLETKFIGYDGLEMKCKENDEKIDIFQKKNAQNVEQMSTKFTSVDKKIELLIDKNAENEEKIGILNENHDEFDFKIKNIENNNLENAERNAKINKTINSIEEKNAENRDKIKQIEENHYLKLKNIEKKNSLLEGQLSELEVEMGLIEKMQIKLDHDGKTNLKELANQLDSMGVKVEYLTAKIDASIESQEWSTSNLEKKWAKHEDEILKINANFVRRISGHSHTNKNVPPSCKELAIKGHPFNGLYLIKNSDTKNIEVVLCNFENTDVSQVFIGNVDIKTKSVNFYVQRTSNFGLFGSVIPFEVARLNEGGAFNIATGIFTAPVAGIYNFQLTAVKNPTVAILWIYLQLNGVNVGIAGTSQGFTGSFGTVSLSSSLRLKAGDRVNLFHAGGILFDNTERYTHFSGSLVKEDMV